MHELTGRARESIIREGHIARHQDKSESDNPHKFWPEKSELWLQAFRDGEPSKFKELN